MKVKTLRRLTDHGRHHLVVLTVYVGKFEQIRRARSPSARHARCGEALSAAERFCLHGGTLLANVFGLRLKGNSNLCSAAPMSRGMRLNSRSGAMKASAPVPVPTSARAWQQTHGRCQNTQAVPVISAAGWPCQSRDLHIAHQHSARSVQAPAVAQPRGIPRFQSTLSLPWPSLKLRLRATYVYMLFYTCFIYIHNLQHLTTM